MSRHSLMTKMDRKTKSLDGKRVSGQRLVSQILKDQNHKS